MRKKIKLGLLAVTLFVFAQYTNVFAMETDRYMLIPGGDAVGINIETNGLIVVDTYPVQTDNGEVTPAGDAGLMKGDIITAINGKTIIDIEEYKNELLARNGVIDLTVNRSGNLIQITIKGVNNTAGELSTGVYLRNKIAGIGTLTYVDPATKKYGALGHEITNQDTNRIIEIRKGELINSKITSIRKATDSQPGEKIAEINFNHLFGTIDKNNQYGIYGEMSTAYFNNKKQLPIAYRDEIQLGKATILTVIDGNNIEEFEIEIIEINNQPTQQIKGIKYVVTDPRLLEATGGIVQGMSGSPIVQDGKIIGAVTHVLVHDSTLGYGVFIEWMLQESEINYKPIKKAITFKPAA